MRRKLRVVSLQLCKLGMGMAETLKSKQYFRKFAFHSSICRLFCFWSDTYEPFTVLNFCRETELLRENPLRNFPLNSLPRWLNISGVLHGFMRGSAFISKAWSISIHLFLQVLYWRFFLFLFFWNIDGLLSRHTIVLPFALCLSCVWYINTMAIFLCRSPKIQNSQVLQFFIRCGNTTPRNYAALPTNYSINLC